MRTHVIGLSLLGVCIGFLAWITKLYLEGRNEDLAYSAGAFLITVAVLGLLIALVPSVRRAFTTD